MNAATAHVVTLTSTDEVDSGAMGEAVSGKLTNFISRSKKLEEIKSTFV